MQVMVENGTYVLAVSGGVDSMVLLDLLRQRPNVKLVVAHFDHGIRGDSARDRALVESIAREHGLSFVFGEGKLGSTANEDAARKARYEFLESVRRSSGAKAIITAHHQDDVLETAILNMLRGTGRRGLTSLKSTDGIVRPMLSHTKEQIKDYAAAYKLRWHEDSTNQNMRYKRNYVRGKLLPKFSAGQRAQLLILLEQLADINRELDEHLTSVLHTQPATDKLDRKWFIGLPHSVAREVLHTWLRRHGIKNVTKKTIERLVTAMKTGKNTQAIHLDKHHDLTIKKDTLALATTER